MQTGILTTEQREGHRLGVLSGSCRALKRFTIFAQLPADKCDRAIGRTFYTEILTVADSTKMAAKNWYQHTNCQQRLPESLSRKQS